MKVLSYVETVEDYGHRLQVKMVVEIGGEKVACVQQLPYEMPRHMKVREMCRRMANYVTEGLEAKLLEVL